MAYNQRNAVADGCHERTDGGLSRFGIELVQAMNRVGMLVDCTHTGYRSSMDVFEVSQAPVVFSHSNARAVWDHERNIRDDQAQACARTGGVIGVVGAGSSSATTKPEPRVSSATSTTSPTWSARSTWAWVWGQLLRDSCLVLQ